MDLLACSGGSGLRLEDGRGRSSLLLQSVLKEYCLTLALSLKSAYIEAHSKGINFPLLLVDESKKNVPNSIILCMAANSVCCCFSRLFFAILILFPAFIAAVLYPNLLAAFKDIPHV
jgi:hypothetical protein